MKDIIEFIVTICGLCNIVQKILYLFKKKTCPKSVNSI